MEEKGGVLHIIFIFIGLACLCLGVFNLLTDEKIELKEEPNYTNKDDNKTDDENLISQINIIKNIDTTITLKNGNEVILNYYLDNETNKGSFNYNGKVSYETNDIELCDEFYLYNDSIISYCTSGSATSGHLYLIDSKGDATKIENFTDQNNKLIPENITLKDGKLIINGMGVLEGSILNLVDKEVYLCDESEIKENNISLDSMTYADYELNIVDDKAEFKLIEITKTIQEFINESCKTVE